MGRFDARAPFAEGARKVNPSGGEERHSVLLVRFINRQAQAFAKAASWRYFRTCMSEQRISGAIDRIERAVARIEAQAGKSGDEADNVTRHEALKARVSASLSQLDDLIESLEK